MKKILIVEDQPEVRELVEVTLGMGDYEILQAENGDNGVAMAKQAKPELILMDVMMPGSINGFEATRQIKDDPELQGCTVLILTARGQASDVEEGRNAGADGYITKPFSPLALIQKVEEVLG